MKTTRYKLYLSEALLCIYVHQDALRRLFKSQRYTSTAKVEKLYDQKYRNTLIINQKSYKVNLDFFSKILYSSWNWRLTIIEQKLIDVNSNLFCVKTFLFLTLHIIKHLYKSNTQK